MGMLESSWEMERKRVRDVSQSGLTHELVLVVVVGLGGLSMEDLMEREKGSLGR